jgi:hypothetical protein
MAALPGALFSIWYDLFASLLVPLIQARSRVALGFLG